MGNINKRTHDDLVKAALQRPGVQKEYDALKEDFELLEIMINARFKAGKSQEEIAKAMKTTTSVVGRLETGGGKKRHSPNLETLRRYAKAVGCNLQIKFVNQAHKRSAT